MRNEMRKKDRKSRMSGEGKEPLAKHRPKGTGGLARDAMGLKGESSANATFVLVYSATTQRRRRNVPHNQEKSRPFTGFGTKTPNSAKK